LIEWQTTLPDFLCDLLSFIGEQIESAVERPQAQYAAVKAARGVIPVFRERVINLDDPIVTQIMLTDFTRLYEGEWEGNWERLAKADSEQFRQEARSLLGLLAMLRTICRRID